MGQKQGTNTLPDGYTPPVYYIQSKTEIAVTCITCLLVLSLWLPLVLAAPQAMDLFIMGGGGILSVYLLTSGCREKYRVWKSVRELRKDLRQELKDK